MALDLEPLPTAQASHHAGLPHDTTIVNIALNTLSKDLQRLGAAFEDAPEPGGCDVSAANLDAPSPGNRQRRGRGA